MGGMSASDAAPLPRLGEVFFDVRGNSRSMRLSWYADTGVAVLSIWQGGMCTGTFRLAIADLPRMVATLQRGPGGPRPEWDSEAPGQTFAQVPRVATGQAEVMDPLPGQDRAAPDYRTGPASYETQYLAEGPGSPPTGAPPGHRTAPPSHRRSVPAVPGAAPPSRRPGPPGYRAEPPGSRDPRLPATPGPPPPRPELDRDIQAGQTTVAVNAPPAGPAMTGYQAGPDVTGYQAGPDVTGYQAGPDVTGYQAGPGMMGYQAGPEPTGYQAGPSRPGYAPEPPARYRDQPPAGEAGYQTAPRPQSGHRAKAPRRRLGRVLLSLIHI